MSEQRARVEVDAANVVERQADSRGRITLASEWGDDRVRVAVLGRVTADSDDESDDGLWYCQFCETAVRSQQRPETCPECSVEGSGLSPLDVRDAGGDE